MRIDQLHPKPTHAEPLEIPTELLGSVQRHQANLMALIVSLQDAGLNETMIDASVRTLIDSYAAELTIAIREMVRSPIHE
ncbi:hypothetical protein [Sphingomonas radiodurans]|uniref:hypothetical protein n=1 Tax=Sphingomonas radiodurans TaxID=2890321 RepID=UPI001E329D12|nr:hypothetical protein [Sphingomonas radiodurans]WBH17429.1 hypothetical protein LLW23_04805 [Sphingomonas radiodurans]